VKRKDGSIVFLIIGTIIKREEIVCVRELQNVDLLGAGF
jgi:hypothetical protein